MPKRTQTPNLLPSATRRDLIAGVSAGVGALALPGARAAERAPSEEISRSREAIHQEVWLKAEPGRVYAALVDAAQFQQIVLNSAAVQGGMVKPTPPAAIEARAGGAFSLFGGHISGRIIELVPSVRIVQAWRPADWAAGIYSIARFELSKDGAGTRLVFDHTGFPAGQSAHLAAGWKGNYWQPLDALLARTSAEAAP